MIRVQFQLQDNEVIYLRDPNGDVVDFVDYSAEQPHDNGTHPCPSNQSYARKIDGFGESILYGNNNDNSWECRVGNEITPGYSNILEQTPPTDELICSGGPMKGQLCGDQPEDFCDFRVLPNDRFIAWYDNKYQR